VLASTAVIGAGHLLPGIQPASAAGDTRFAVDLRGSGATVPNIFSHMTFFRYQPTWGNQKMDAQAPLRVVSKFPWVQEAHLQFATGGCYKPFPGCLTNRDLFADPANPAGGYDFSALERAVGNILKQGLKPYIDLGGIPVKLAPQPFINPYFDINTRPPADYKQYHDYVQALVFSLAAQFGLAEVRTWRWSVIDEIENYASFETPDRNWLSTTNAYFKLYDYTVGALEEVLGAANVNVGVHCMCVINGLWDERSILDHVVNGPNQYNGGSSTQLDFVGVSYYDHTLGQPQNLAEIDATIADMRDRANSLGLVNLPIGVDEGGVQYDVSGRPIAYEETGVGWQGSWAAMLFKRLLDLNVSWYTTRTMSTKSRMPIGGIRHVESNVIELASKLAGSTRKPTVKSGSPADANDQVQSVAAYNPATKTAYVMLVNHNPSKGAATAEPAAVDISGIAPAAGSTVNVKQWIVDDTHANFWPTWLYIANACKVPDNGYKWSKYSAGVPDNLLTQWKPCWKNYKNMYKQASIMQVASTTDVAPSGNGVNLSTTLEHHGVTLYEIGNVAVAP
jgi:hypothetical protein